MATTRRGVHALALLTMVALCVGSEAHGGSARVGSAVREALGASEAIEVMVAFRAPSEAGRAARAAAIRARRALVLGSVPEGGFSPSLTYDFVPAMRGFVTADGLEALAAHADVLAVDIPQRGSQQLAQSVPLINADTVQAGGDTGSGVEVAVLDSGARHTHNDLSGDVVAGQCFCALGGGCCPNASSSQSGLAAITDGTGHGTNVSSIVTSTGTSAPTGVAPDTDLSVIRVLNGAGSGLLSDWTAGLDWIIGNRLGNVDIVNMSLGSNALYSGICDEADADTIAMGAAVDTLREAGVLVVASSGNQGQNTRMGAPACLRNVVAVGAVYDANIGSYNWGGVCMDSTTSADQYACWSNTSSHTDLAAPGCRTLGAGKASDSATASWCGTSQAAPHVAAVAALIKSRTPFLEAFEIEHCLRSSATSVTDAGAGISLPRVDAVDATATCDFNFVSLFLDSPRVKVAFKKAGVNDDKLVIRGYLAPVTPIDPLTEAVSVRLADAGGETFSATVPAGSPNWISKRPGKYRYKDRALQRGVKVMVISEHPKNPLGNPNGTFRFKVVAQNLDLSRVNTTSGIEVSVAVGSNLHSAFPTNCSFVAGRSLRCKP